MESTKTAPSKSALILGGGGMFGAYQAGVWQVVAPRFQPDVFIGASIGGLNAWAMAGGCPPDQWAEEWRTMKMGAPPGLRRPRSLLGGCIETEVFERTIQSVHARFTPRVPCAIAVTDLLRLKPWLVVTPDVTWRHLAASCAVFGIMPQYRIDGRLQTDGGILSSVPLWAAAELGVTHAVTVNILPHGGPWWLRMLKKCLPRVPEPPLRGQLRIEHAGPLGRARDAVVWTPENAARLVELGRADAEVALPALQRLLETF
ncbi:MAG: patatin-like phospholipase family protein [Bryobacterales bacterium]|nr:patatin-like phospholipase family protein [Bryobacterales bacterium]